MVCSYRAYGKVLRFCGTPVLVICDLYFLLEFQFKNISHKATKSTKTLRPCLLRMSPESFGPTGRLAVKILCEAPFPGGSLWPLPTIHQTFTISIAIL